MNGPGPLRLGVMSQAGPARDALLTGNGPGGGILFPTGPGASDATAIPVLNPLTLALLVVLLGGALRHGRRHPGAAKLLVLVVALAGAGLVWAAFVRDGQTNDWAGVAPLATDPQGDADSPVDLIALFGKVEGANLNFRIDARITLTAPPPTNQAPQVNAGADQTLTLPASANLNGTVSDDGLPNPPGAVTITWSKDSGPGAVTFANVHAASTTATFSAAGTYVLKLTASDGDQSAADSVTIAVQESPGSLPPDPTTVAPPLDPTIATTTFTATEFLYTGTDPIQTGVALGTIDPKRAAVIRGRVLDRANQPLPGVTLTVLDHPEFGQTLSRADGGFDLVVNGGGYLTVNYQKAGSLPAQRQANVPWQDFVVLDDVVLIPRDARATTVDLTALTFQVARGSPVTDGDGTRQAMLLIPPGTTAQVYNPDGSLRAVTRLTLRLTEYTVSANGPQAMPAELPPTSGYTYAVEIGADEAPTKIDGRDVLFNQPVAFYVDNFLNFPVGIEVPVGYYDSSRGVWIPSDNGRIVQILRLADGLAELDVTGTGVPADADALAELGITDAERARLATLYPVGTRLWRVHLNHLSTWDCNWPFGPPPDAEPPQPPDVDDPWNEDDHNPDDPCEAAGSIIECETQTLGERIPLAGTGLALHYRSNRVLGRRSRHTVVIPLSGDRVPASLKRIEYGISIAGLLQTGTVSAEPNQRVRFTWSGRDAYGRQLIGGQPASVTVKYVYDGVYYGWEATFLVRNFGLPGDVVISRDWARQEITLTRRYTVPLSALTPTVGLTDLRRGGLGAWTLDLHQVHDPVGQVLYQGDGRQRKPEPSLSATTASFLGRIVTAFAGTGEAGFAGDGGPATQAQLTSPVGVAVAPDGGVLIADAGNHRIRRVDTDGRIATVAGTGEAGFAGDGGPATQAQLNAPTAVAIAPGGGILIADTGNRVVRRIGADGHITTVAGFYWDGGGAGIAPAQRVPTAARALALDGDGDGGPATQARLSNPRGVAAARDGGVLIADPDAQVIRRVGPDGTITTFAGTGEAGFAGDGGPATRAQLNYPTAVAVAPDGGVWIADADNHRIRRVGPDGRIATVAGTGVAGGFGEGDGGPATEAQLSYPHHLALARDGTLLIAEGGDARIRRVGPDGIITTWAGAAVGREDVSDGGLRRGRCSRSWGDWRWRRTVGCWWRRRAPIGCAGSARACRPSTGAASPWPRPTAVGSTNSTPRAAINSAPTPGPARLCGPSVTIRSAG
ncbi:MAG: hypothetical protein RKO66_16215 [Candidatus Contendobacter sp.]|nr:hypothetical protein [Candidatus Contendobacter sp.]MDS4058535.1 hypothetical protein [Candidatus Contendobacter sp.]